MLPALTSISPYVTPPCAAFFTLLAHGRRRPRPLPPLVVLNSCARYIGGGTGAAERCGRGPSSATTWSCVFGLDVCCDYLCIAQRRCGAASSSLGSLPPCLSDGGGGGVWRGSIVRAASCMHLFRRRCLVDVSLARTVAPSRTRICLVATLGYCSVCIAVAVAHVDPYGGFRKMDLLLSCAATPFHFCC